MFYKRARREVISCVFLRFPSSCCGCVAWEPLAQLQAVALHWISACWWHPGHSEPSVGVPITPRSIRSVPFSSVLVSFPCSADAEMLQGLLFVMFNHSLRLVSTSQCPCHVCSLCLKGFLTGKEAINSSFPLLNLMVSDFYFFSECFLSNTPLE